MDQKISRIPNHVGNHKIIFSEKFDKNFKKKITVNSFHNYGIKKLSNYLIPLARAKDNSIELFIHKEKKIIGIMWHPERYKKFKKIDKKIFNMNLMELVVLASGRGTRLKKLNQKHPKCLCKINGDKTLIDYISENFKKFKKVFMIVGYKRQLLKKYQKKNVKLIINSKYKTTNMVYSLSLAKNFISNDIIVVYSDILFDQRILDKLLKKRGNILR